MIFRYLKPLLGLILILSMTVVQCAKEAEHKELEKKKVQPIDIGNFQCLTSFDQNIKNYFNSNMSQEEIKEFWACMGRSIQLFEKYIRGKDKNRYTSSEIRGFLSYYFDLNTDDKWWEAFMKLKTTLIPAVDREAGLNYVTRKEITQFKELLVELEIITKDLYPHLDTLIRQKTLPLPTTPQIEASFLAFHRAASRFGGWAQRNNIQLEFVTLKEILKNLKVEKNSGVNIESWVDFLAAGKNLFVGGEESGIDAHEWALFFRVSSSLFELYRRYDILKDYDLSQGEGLAQLDVVMKKGDLFLSETVLRKKDHLIPHHEIYEFIDAIGVTKLLPPQFSVDLVKLGWSILVNQVLKSTNSPMASSPTGEGLGFSHLEVLRREFQNWFQAQTAINNGHINQDIKCDKLSTSQSNEIEKLLACSLWPLRKDSRGRLVLSQALLTSKWTREDISSLNWKRFLVRQLVRTYSDNPDDISSGLTEAMLGQAYIDLKPLLVAFNLVDKEDNSFYKGLFMEANLFTPSSDGNFKVSQGEGVAYLHYVLTGMKGAKFVIPLLDHCLMDPKIPGQFHSYCYWNTLKMQLSGVLQSMPELSRYMENLDDKTWSSLVRNLNTTIHRSHESKALILKTHVVKTFVFLSYLETIMLRYDEGLNEKMYLSEVQKAIPLFILHLSIANAHPYVQRGDIYLSNIFNQIWGFS